MTADELKVIAECEREFEQPHDSADVDRRAPVALRLLVLAGLAWLAWVVVIGVLMGLVYGVLFVLGLVR